MLNKRDLLDDWMSLYKDQYSIKFVMKGQSIIKEKILEEIEKHYLRHEDSHNFVYLLCISNDENLVPAYIGKSVNPVNRWKSHIDRIQKGTGSYKKWKDILLQKNEIAKYTLLLFVIPEKSIATPPIPNFPTSVGSVEYQLISLVSDVYPSILLNHEGNRR